MLTRAERDSQFLLFNTCLGKATLKARDTVTLYCRSTTWWEWVTGKCLSHGKGNAKRWVETGRDPRVHDILPGYALY